MHKGPQLGGRTRVRLMGKVRRAAPFWCIASRCQCTSGRGLTPLRARRPVVSTGHRLGLRLAASPDGAQFSVYCVPGGLRRRPSLPPFSPSSRPSPMSQGCRPRPPLRGKRQSSLCLPREASLGPAKLGSSLKEATEGLAQRKAAC